MKRGSSAKASNSSLRELARRAGDHQLEATRSSGKRTEMESTFGPKFVWLTWFNLHEFGEVPMLIRLWRPTAHSRSGRYDGSL